MMTIKEKIERYKEKHPIPEAECDCFGPSAYIPMYKYEIKEKNGKITYMAEQRHFGSSYNGHSYSWSSNAIPPKCVYGMMVDIDEYIGLVCMYEIKADIPDLRGSKNIYNAYWKTHVYWQKADFEIYIDVLTNKIYDKNGNTVRKSDKIFPCIKPKNNTSYYKGILSIRRKLATFKEMKQVCYSNLPVVKSGLRNVGCDLSCWYDVRNTDDFERMVAYFLTKPTIYNGARTDIEKRNAFCWSWAHANRYKQTKGAYVYKIPEQYDGKNVYQIFFYNSWKAPVLYLVGKEYCAFSLNYGEKIRINDVPSDKEYKLTAEKLSVFAGDPDIGWVSKMLNNESEKVDPVVLVRSISNVFYEQLSKMGLYNLLHIHMLLHGGNRKTGNVLKYYGMTKKQAEVIDKYFEETYISKESAESLFETINGFFCFSESVSKEKDFETIFGCMKDLRRWRSWSWSDLRNVFSTPYYVAETITKAEQDIIMDQKKKFLRLIDKQYGRISYDLVDMYVQNFKYEETGFTNISLVCAPHAVPKEFWLEVMPTIHSYQDIIRKHDFYTEKCRENSKDAERKRDEERQKYWESLEGENKKRKEKWEFSNEKFSVLFPMKLSDVRQEGDSLHHCVGGYAERHLKNETTILFLRKNEEIDTSFYTIEIRAHEGRHYRVAQVHGVYNKWVGNDPDAAIFLYRYFKSHNVECDKYILLRTSSGYVGYDTNMLDESILTDED